MTRKYYTLVARNSADEDWFVEFGDYDREIVQGELDDLAYSHAFGRGYARKNMKIMATQDAKQLTIDNAVDALNGRNPDMIAIG